MPGSEQRETVVAVNLQDLTPTILHSCIVECSPTNSTDSLKSQLLKTVPPPAKTVTPENSQLSKRLFSAS